MNRRMRRTAAVTAAAVLTAIALIDVARERTWDLAPVLAAVLVLQLGVLVGSGRSRPEVTVRVDLHRWLSQRSAQTGEDPDRLADRCIAAYRAELTSDAGDRDSLAAPQGGQLR